MSRMNDRTYNDRTYRVGYAKPPLHSRFTKGHSGNPGGRPRAPQTIDAKMAALLSEHVAARRRGKSSDVPRRADTILKLVEKALRVGRKSSDMPRREAMILELVESAVRGSFPHLEFLLSAARAIEPKIPRVVITYG